MATMSDAQKSFAKWVNASNVGDFEGETLTIIGFNQELVGKDQENKYVLTFNETPLKLVLSKGRSQELTDIVGEKASPVGTKITLIQGVSHGRPAIQILPV